MVVGSWPFAAVTNYTLSRSLWIVCLVVRSFGKNKAINLNSTMIKLKLNAYGISSLWYLFIWKGTLKTTAKA